MHANGFRDDLYTKHHFVANVQSFIKYIWNKYGERCHNLSLIHYLKSDTTLAIAIDNDFIYFNLTYRNELFFPFLHKKNYLLLVFD